jgi:hypothetical protein
MAEGDIVRGGFLEILGNLLDRGVQVVLEYGDRDYIGNCTSSPILLLDLTSNFLNRDRWRSGKSRNKLHTFFWLCDSWICKHQYKHKL